MRRPEENTNRQPGTKYFVDARNVVSKKPAGTHLQDAHFSRVIDASHVVFGSRHIVLPGPNGSDGHDMEVNVVKEGDSIKGITISCPCGRRAELNFEYGPTDGADGKGTGK